MKSISRAPVSIDLFAGGGGLSVGLEQAGFRVALATDVWEPAAKTYRANFSDTPFLVGDARDLRARDLLEAAGLSEAPDLIAGGPPCQGFSSAGLRRSGDQRNSLVSVFSRLVAEIAPRFVLFENVEGFLTTGRGTAVIALLDPLIEAGFHIHLRKVNAANYGVPQLRKRVVAVGAIGNVPGFPEPTHTAFGAPGAHLATISLPPAPTVEESLSRLPPPTYQTNPRLQGHVARQLSPSALDRALNLEQGETMRSLPAALQHHSYQRRAYRRVMDGTPTARRGGAPAGMRRLSAEEPSKAVTASAIGEFLHPYEDRFLTIRECAHLQGFPDSFCFEGTRSQQATLVGNAVPPPLARVLAESIAVAANGEMDRRRSGSAGRLVSFLPTLAQGMSPALAEVTELISRRYGTPSQAAGHMAGRQLTFNA